MTPSAELLGWFDAKPCWRYVMRLRADTWIHGTATPMGCQVRRLRLPRVHCRSFRDVSLWAERIHRAHLLMAFPTGLAVTEPLYLVSNLDPTLDLVWTYGQRFCCEQLFRDQKSGIFQLESSGLCYPKHIDRLLLVVAISMLAISLWCTLAHDLEHQPARAPQQVDQAQDERRSCQDGNPARSAGSQLLEQQEEWQLERRRFFSEATMAKIPQPEELLELTDGDPAQQAATSIS